MQLVSRLLATKEQISKRTQTRKLNFKRQDRKVWRPGKQSRTIWQVIPKGFDNRNTEELLPERMTMHGNSKTLGKYQSSDPRSPITTSRTNTKKYTPSHFKKLPLTPKKKTFKIKLISVPSIKCQEKNYQRSTKR